MLIFVIYFAIAAAILAGLTTMLLHIGKLLGACPVSGAAAWSAAITITTGFVAIGIGGIFLLGALMSIIPQSDPTALTAVIGLASLALGLGFSQAAVSLRGAITQIQKAIQEAEMAPTGPAGDGAEPEAPAPAA